MQASGTAGGTEQETIIIDTIDITGIADGSPRHGKCAFEELEQLTDKTDKNLKEIAVWLIYSVAVRSKVRVDGNFSIEHRIIHTRGLPVFGGWVDQLMRRSTHTFLNMFNAQSLLIATH